MRMSRVCRFELYGMRARAPDQIDDVAKGHVAMMRSGVIASAHVHAQLFWRDVRRGAV